MSTMELPPGFDVNCYVNAVIEGDLESLQGIVAQYENGEGPGKVSYAALKGPDGSNALHWAADVGKASTCRYLVQELKFDVDESTESGETPLHRAVLRKHRPTMMFFINSDADVKKCNSSGESPLHFVALEGTKDFVKLLVSKGADLSATSMRGTPLHYAAGAGNFDTLECLLSLKADPDPASVDMSPLLASMLTHSPACMDLLLKAGADPNRRCVKTTLLHFAAAALDEGVIRRLLKAGADPNLPGFDGVTPLEHAAMLGRPRVVKLLFPFTNRIGRYPEWSIRGVMQHSQSKETIVLLNSRIKELLQMLKTEGRNAFERKKYLDALNFYNQVVRADPTDEKVLFNRSLCFTNLHSDEYALDDARKCIELQPGWAKAHFREGAAWKALKNFKKAEDAFSRALALDPGNEEIQQAHREVCLATKTGTKKPTVEFSLSKYVPDFHAV